MPNIREFASLFALSLAPAFLAGCAPRPLAVTEMKTSYQLGETTVFVAEYAAPGTGVRLLNVHENEQTSVDAGIEILKRRGGSILRLEHTGERLITFAMNGDTFRVDPNRIFTDTGARSTLERHSQFDEAAFTAVRQFADIILSRYGFDQADLVVAIHNNGLNGYSIMSYTEGGTYEDDAEDVHVEPGRDINDFFFVTERRLFEHFKNLGYNVVLQDNEAVTDDGSLSVYCGRHGIPYINVEAGHGHRRAQEEMIRRVYEMVEGRSGYRGT